jgi:hypothetical protein
MCAATAVAPATTAAGNRPYDQPMPRHRRPDDPLQRASRLLVDGSNLAHAARRGHAPLPPTAVIGRLRAAIPPHIAIEIVFDGPPEPGMRGTRIAAGVTVRHATRRTADELLLELAATGDVVVTDDRELRDALSARDATSVRTDWLLDRLARGRAMSPSIANRRPPRMHDAGHANDADDVR